MSIRFLTSQTAWVDTEWLRRSLSDLVEATITRLDEAGMAATTLHKEWSALKTLEAEEVDFCRACGRLGLDPFAEGQDFARGIEAVFEQLDELNREELFDAIRPKDLERGLAWVNEATATAETAIPGVELRSEWADVHSLRQELEQDQLFTRTRLRCTQLVRYSLRYSGRGRCAQFSTYPWGWMLRFGR